MKSPFNAKSSGDQNIGAMGDDDYGNESYPVNAPVLLRRLNAAGATNTSQDHGDGAVCRIFFQHILGAGGSGCAIVLVLTAGMH